MSLRELLPKISNSVESEAVWTVYDSTYACDPGRPGQKGLVENSIRLMRHWLPRKLNYHSISDKDIYKVSAKLNNMYRNSLNKKTANQVYHKRTVQRNC